MAPAPKKHTCVMFAIKRSLGEATYCRLLIIFRPPYVQCSCFIQKVATRLGYSLLQEAESVGQRTFVAGLFFHLFSSHALTKVSPLYVASLECKHSHACDLTWNVLDTKLGPQRKKPPSRQSDLRQGMQLRRIHGGSLRETHSSAGEQIWHMAYSSNLAACCGFM